MSNHEGSCVQCNGGIVKLSQLLSLINRMTAPLVQYLQAATFFSLKTTDVLLYFGLKHKYKEEQGEG